MASKSITLTQLGAIPQILRVFARPKGVLEIHFSNGDSGNLQLSKHLPLTGYFAPLAEQDFFQQVFVDHGTLCWPGNIDLDPVVVHAWTMGEPIELAEALPA